MGKIENTGTENIKQLLIEIIADFLDRDDVKLEEIMNCMVDPQIREISDLHINMAEAAMAVYQDHMKQNH